LFSGNEVDVTNNQGRPVKVKIPTRLITRDCFILENQYHIEEKAENTIVRTTGVANPRHAERVSPDSVFELDMVLDVYDADRANIIPLLKTLKLGFGLMENDYLGGSGSRGYGKVEFSRFELKFPYKSEEPTQEVRDFKFKE